jgi:hypothetical protein
MPQLPKWVLSMQTSNQNFLYNGNPKVWFREEQTNSEVKKKTNNKKKHRLRQWCVNTKMCKDDVMAPIRGILCEHSMNNTNGHIHIFAVWTAWWQTLVTKICSKFGDIKNIDYNHNCTVNKKCKNKPPEWSYGLLGCNTLTWIFIAMKTSSLKTSRFFWTNILEGGHELGLLYNILLNMPDLCSSFYVPLTCFLPLRWMASILRVSKMGRWVHIMHVNLCENMKYTFIVTDQCTHIPHSNAFL